MISKWLINKFITWAEKREKHPLRVVRHEDNILLLARYQPFWQDEYISGGKHYNRPPWWRPFNILLHKWINNHNETMHDHPRWSITIVLRGTLIEHTPWTSKILTPGAIIFRSHKYIHAFEFLPGEQPWTLFIVGRRNHEQNGFIVKPFNNRK